jgi:hypothetical protein
VHVAELINPDKSTKPKADAPPVCRFDTSVEPPMSWKYKREGIRTTPLSVGVKGLQPSYSFAVQNNGNVGSDVPMYTSHMSYGAHVSVSSTKTHNGEDLEESSIHPTHPSFDNASQILEHTPASSGMLAPDAKFVQPSRRLK